MSFAERYSLKTGERIRKPRKVHAVDTVVARTADVGPEDEDDNVTIVPLWRFLLGE